MEFYTTVDDELYEELCELAGEKVVHFELWEDSLADELEAESEEAEEAKESAEEDTVENSFDMDLYLDGGIFFQLYSAALFPKLDADPLQGEEEVRKALAELIRKGLTVSEVAVDENDGLILVLAENSGEKSNVALYCSVGGWLLEEWDELPE